MKILITSDLHGFLPCIEQPADLLLICGDIVPLSVQSNGHKSKVWFRDVFKKWAEELPVDKVIFIAGNHDWFPYWDEGIGLKKLFPHDSKVIYIQDELYEYKGIKIYGTPWCKQFYNWAFNLNEEGLKEKYSQIPEGIDILITHDAPSQNEVGMIHDGIYKGEDASNYILSDIIKQKAPKYCFCGHIHSGNHLSKEIDGITFANCSYVNEQYVPVNDLHTLYIDDKDA